MPVINKRQQVSLILNNLTSNLSNHVAACLATTRRRWGERAVLNGKSDNAISTCILRKCECWRRIVEEASKEKVLCCLPMWMEFFLFGSRWAPATDGVQRCGQQNGLSSDNWPDMTSGKLRWNGHVSASLTCTLFWKHWSIELFCGTLASWQSWHHLCFLVSMAFCVQQRVNAHILTSCCLCCFPFLHFLSLAISCSRSSHCRLLTIDPWHRPVWQLVIQTNHDAKGFQSESIGTQWFSFMGCIQKTKWLEFALKRL